MKKIGVLTSGGDAPGMNACVRAVVRTGAYLDMEVFGIERGYDGLIAGDIEQLGPRDVSDTIQRGGTILKTARSEAFLTKEGFDRAVAMMKNFKLEGLVVIGGNGSLSGAVDLKKAGVHVIGLPGTIDNDLPFSDFTIGFDTAVNTALSAISNVRDTSQAHERTTIIEVMGRECGDIAIYAGITGGAEIILVPEVPVDLDDVCRQLIESRNKGKGSSIIVKAEGVDIDSNILDEEITKRTGLDVKVAILGYIQRGGSPTAQDRLLASIVGNEAVKLLHKGVSGKAIGMQGGQIAVHDIEKALKLKKRSVEDLIDLARTLAM
ncbi:MAG: 6-phosphofructokinase [Clostridiales Family XIII bacterium]|jgi:6-phosphofructokinase 1|nr:6-phosphofructokinase [Clostridiales Family XIII bacterium]